MTTFALWQKKLGLNNQQAADALGMTERRVIHFRKGIGSRGNPARPDKALRLAMRAVEKKLSPWPE